MRGRAKRDPDQPVSGTPGHPKTHSHIGACKRCADETRPPSVPPLTGMPPTALESQEWQERQP